MAFCKLKQKVQTKACILKFFCPFAQFDSVCPASLMGQVLYFVSGLCAITVRERADLSLIWNVCLYLGHKS